MLKLLLTDELVLNFVADLEKKSIPTEEWPAYLQMLKQDSFMIQSKIERKLQEIAKLASAKLEKEIIIDNPKNDSEVIVKYFQKKFLPQLEKLEEAFFKIHPSWIFLKGILKRAIEKYYKREIKTRHDKFFEIKLSKTELDLFLEDEDTACQGTLAILSEIGFQLDGGLSIGGLSTEDKNKLCFQIK